jgi:hypothetical protein
MTDTLVATVTNDDAGRLSARREIRRQIAAKKVLKQKWDVFQQQIREFDDQADAAANVHQETTRPIQERLSVIEQQIESALADRLEVDSGLLAERAELLAAVKDANEKLSDATERVNRLKVPIQREAAAIGTEMPFQHLINKLAGIDIARDDLFDAHFSCREAVEWAGHRVAAAEKQVKTWREHIEFHEQGKRLLSDVAAYRRRIRRWEVELCAAQDALAEAKAKADKAYRTMIDE